MPASMFVAAHLAVLLAVASPVAERVSRFLPVVSLELPDTQLAGKYTQQSSELAGRVGLPLTGSDLYLFGNHTYIYVEWGCVLQPTIFDKGTWRTAGPNLELTPDREVTWRTPNEHHFAVLRRTGRPQEVRLMGTQRDLMYFEQHAHDQPHDPEFTFLLTSLSREHVFKTGESAGVRASLLRDAWNPQFFSQK